MNAICSKVEKLHLLSVQQLYRYVQYRLSFIRSPVYAICRFRLSLDVFLALQLYHYLYVHRPFSIFIVVFSIFNILHLNMSK